MKVSGLPVKVFAKPGSLAQPRLALTARLEDRAVLFAVGRKPSKLSVNMSPNALNFRSSVGRQLTGDPAKMVGGVAPDNAERF